MAEKELALVEPALLIWARTSACLAIPEVAEKINVRPEKIEEWEAGGSHPSIPQLRNLAKAYKRLLSLFFLPEPPTDFMPLRDFRRLPDSTSRTLSPTLAYEIRAAQERRQIAVELSEELGHAMHPFPVTATVDSSPEDTATEIRKVLGITLASQRRWRDPTVAFKSWREAIEAHGVLVFALSGAHHQVPLEEVRGFAIAEPILPVIVVNGKDKSNGKIFTLLHELAHVCLGQSVIENELLPAESLAAPDVKIERFCNTVAAAVLMPRDALLARTELATRTDLSAEWDEVDISNLATELCVSREALLIRLQTLGHASGDFVRSQLAEYARQYARMRQANAGESSGGPIPQHISVISHVGKTYARIVIEAYQTRRVTLNTASSHLGTKSRHIPKIETMAMGGTT